MVTAYIIGYRYSEEHDDVWVSDCLHRVALAEEVTQTHIPILNLELLHHHLDFSPSRPVYHSVPSLVDLGLELDLFPRDFGV